ncbi:MAG: hypothetical protein LQ337_003688 [Flavoplaca oasis]|nr:MAG: hypothetical protein LQ337_003688 [Flavoplaca oasis]
MFGAEFLATLQDEMAQMEKRKKRKLKLPFDAFPQEIKNHIIGFVSPVSRDLKNVRLLSHNLAETAAPFLFGELLLTPWTLGRFGDQRSLQTIYSHVRNLTISDTVLPNIAFEDWKAASHGGSEAWFNRYQDLYCEQERYLQELSQSDIIKELSNKGSHISHSPREFKIETVGYAIWGYKSLSARNLSLRHDVTSKVLFDIGSLKIKCTRQHSTHVLGDMASLITNVAAGSRIRMTNLTIKNMPHSVQDAQGKKDVRRLPGIVEMCNGLVQINLWICLDVFDFNQQAPFKLIGECLSAAKSLEDLRLEIFWRNRKPEMNATTDCLANLSLSTPRLKKLQLCRIYTRIASVQSLLCAHHKTLEVLEIDRMSLRTNGEHQTGLRVTIGALTTHLRFEWVYVNSVFRANSRSFSSHQDVWMDLTGGMDQKWSRGRMEAKDINDFCSKLFKLHNGTSILAIPGSAMNLLGFKAVRNDTIVSVD